MTLLLDWLGKTCALYSASNKSANNSLQLMELLGAYQPTSIPNARNRLLANPAAAAYCLLSFSIASRLARNSLSGLHSGNFAASATR